MADTRSRAPRTWRCLNPACGAVWCDLVGGTPRYHTCRQPKPAELAAGAAAPLPADVRDENVHQLRPGGPVRIHKGGAGRVLIGLGDLVTEATMAEYMALLTAPAIGPAPAPEDEPAPRHAAAAMPAVAE